MDLIFCGIIDIVIILFLLIVSIVGYKKGFLNKALGMVSLIVAIMVAFTFCTQLASVFKNMEIIYPSIYDKIYSNVSSSAVLSNPDASITEVLISLDIPNFIAEFVAKNIGEKIVAADVAVQISEYVTQVCMNVMCFVMLFIGVFIATFILKGITKILRGNAFIKLIDGILGAAFHVCVYAVVIYFLFTILHFIIDLEWFSNVKEFLVVDMMLDNPDEFRVSKFIYEHNVIYNIISNIF